MNFGLLLLITGISLLAISPAPFALEGTQHSDRLPAAEREVGPDVDTINEVQIDFEFEALDHEQLKADREMTEQQIKQTRQDYENAVKASKELKAKNDALSKIVRKEMEKADAEQKATEDASKKVEKLQSDLVAGQAEIDKAQKQIDDYSKNQEALKTKAAEIQAKISEIESHKQVLDPKKKELEGQYLTLVSQKEEAQKRADASHSEYENAVKAAEQLKAKNDELAVTIKTQTEKASSDQKMAEETSNQMVALHQQFSTQDADLKVLRSKVEALRKRDNELSSTVSRIKNKINTFKAERKKLNPEKFELEGQYLQLVQEKKDAQKQIKRSKRAFFRAKKDIKVLKNKNEKLSEAIQLQTAKVERAKAKAFKAISKANEMRARHQARLDKIDKLRRAVLAIKRKETSEKVAAVNLQTKMVNLNEEKEQLLVEKAAVEWQLSLRAKNTKQLRDQFKKMASENIKLKKTIKKKEARIKKMLKPSVASLGGNREKITRL